LTAMRKREGARHQCNEASIEKGFRPDQDEFRN